MPRCTFRSAPALRPTRLLALLFLALAAARSEAAERYVFTTIAGQPPQPGSADGSDNAARFWFPGYTAVDSSGNVYVADTNNHTIRKITAAGVVTTLAGLPGQSGSADGPSANARFNRPHGLATDGSGNLYVADRENHTVRKITAAGVVTTLAGLAGRSGSVDGNASAARFNSPRGLVSDPFGNIYVADSLNFTVRKITPAGVVSTFVGTSGNPTYSDGTGLKAGLCIPGGITIDGTGNLYLTELGSVTVRKITPVGVVTTLAGNPFFSADVDGVGAGAHFSYPQGIASDPGGTLYIADTGSNTVRKVTPGGTVTTLAGTKFTGGRDGAGDTAQFSQPTGISVDRAGNLYVGDAKNHSIRKITPTGFTTTLAGPTANNGSADGRGKAARFSYPLGITGDSKGNLFICDETNRTIRRIAPTGDVSTFAGTPNQGPANVDGLGSAARFGQPAALGIDRSDNLYVADNIMQTVRKITPAAVVTTLAGAPGQSPVYRDGIGTSARFSSPNSAVIDAAGAIFVADTTNYVIRKITPDGAVTTIAGLAGTSDAIDGPRTVARFVSPAGLAVDQTGNVFISDQYAIRKLTPSGIVSTFAGSVIEAGSNDGIGTSARFGRPLGLAIDGEGNIFVADVAGLIRKITAAGVVTTIGGSTAPYFTPDGTGTNAHFLAPTAIWVNPQGVLYLTDSEANTVIKGELETIPTIATPPQSATVLLGSPVVFTVVASGGDLRYQWKFDGSILPGATAASYSTANVAQSNRGGYTVDVTNFLGTTTSSTANLDVDLPGRLINLSVLAGLASADDSLTVGVSVGGNGTSGAKPLLARGVGPSLANVGVAAPVNGAKIQVFVGSTPTAENSGWAGDPRITATALQVGAFPLASPSSRDAAYFWDDAGGSNRSMTISGTSAGFVLAEIYDATPTTTYAISTPRLINVSVLKNIGSGLTAGFVIGGTTPVNVLVRAIGPSLAAFGVAGALPQPRLELFDGSSTSVAVNTVWGGAPALASAFTGVGAFPLEPASRDAAILISLAPGSYTARVSGVGGTTGAALVEVYEVR